VRVEGAAADGKGTPVDGHAEAFRRGFRDFDGGGDDLVADVVAFEDSDRQGAGGHWDGAIGSPVLANKPIKLVVLLAARARATRYSEGWQRRTLAFPSPGVAA
jgi:hypothetical protein